MPKTMTKTERQNLWRASRRAREALEAEWRMVGKILDDTSAPTYFTIDTNKAALVRVYYMTQKQLSAITATTLLEEFEKEMDVGDSKIIKCQVWIYVKTKGFHVVT